MVKIDKPVPENYPSIFEVFDYMFLGFVVLGLVVVVFGISILFKFIKTYGLGDTKDILHPGLRFPPGHFAHIIVLFVLYLFRALGTIVVVFAFIDGFNIENFRETNYWEFFVLGLLPAMFWFGMFLVLGEWFKFQWMGSATRWEEYIEAYTLDLPEPPNEGIDEEYR
jgi:hypothetical protein